MERVGCQGLVAVGVGVDPGLGVVEITGVGMRGRRRVVDLITQTGWVRAEGRGIFAWGEEGRATHKEVISAVAQLAVGARENDGVGCADEETSRCDRLLRRIPGGQRRRGRRRRNGDESKLFGAGFSPAAEVDAYAGRSRRCQRVGMVPMNEDREVMEHWSPSSWLMSRGMRKKKLEGQRIRSGGGGNSGLGLLALVLAEVGGDEEQDVTLDGDAGGQGKMRLSSGQVGKDSRRSDCRLRGGAMGVATRCGL